MYIYVCPYCDPCEKAHLEMAMVKEVNCKYDNEDVCEEKHKCKETMVCKRCESQFNITKQFLKEQKRKIKDG